MSDVLIPVGAFVVGVIVGAVGHSWITDREWRRAAQFYRTGGAAPRSGEADPRISASPEASALRTISEDSINRGVEDLMTHAREAGIPMSRKDAEAQARELLSMAQPLGGAH